MLPLRNGSLSCTTIRKQIIVIRMNLFARAPSQENPNLIDSLELGLSQKSVTQIDSRESVGANAQMTRMIRMNVGNGRNTVSRALFRKRELTEFCGKLGEFCEEIGEFALAHK